MLNWRWIPNGKLSVSIGWIGSKSIPTDFDRLHRQCWFHCEVIWAVIDHVSQTQVKSTVSLYNDLHGLSRSSFELFRFLKHKRAQAISNGGNSGKQVRPTLSASLISLSVVATFSDHSTRSLKTRFVQFCLPLASSKSEYNLKSPACLNCFNGSWFTVPWERYSPL